MISSSTRYRRRPRSMTSSAISFKLRQVAGPKHAGLWPIRLVCGMRGQLGGKVSVRFLPGAIALPSIGDNGLARVPDAQVGRDDVVHTDLPCSQAVEWCR